MVKLNKTNAPDKSSSAVSAPSGRSRIISLLQKNLPIIAAVGTIFTIGILVFGTVVFRENGNAVGCSDDSSNELMQQASAAIKKSNTRQLHEAVNRIKAFENYDSDADCLYVLTVYHINISATAEARDYYDKFEKAYVPEVGYDDDILFIAKPPNKLKASVEFLEKQSKEIEKNSIRGPEV